MAAADADPIRPHQRRCPRCGASDGTLSLLTSMHRYFACRRCNCRWQEHVGPHTETVVTPAADPDLSDA